MRLDAAVRGDDLLDKSKSIGRALGDHAARDAAAADTDASGAKNAAAAATAAAAAALATRATSTDAETCTLHYDSRKQSSRAPYAAESMGADCLVDRDGVANGVAARD